MRLIIITKENFFDEEANIINHLFEAGLETLHLRKPFSVEEEVKLLLSEINPDYHSRIVLHDHFSLLSSFNLKGVHLNRRNPETSQKKTISISTSCHTLEEVVIAQKKCNYLFLSPIFDSISKSGYRQGFTSKQLLEAKENGVINHKVMALGGITPETVSAVTAFGFGGIAVLGWLWGDIEKSEDKKGLLERFEQLKQVLQ